MSARQNLWRKRACHGPIPPPWCPQAPAMSVTQQRTHCIGRNSHVTPLHGKMREKASQKFCKLLLLGFLALGLGLVFLRGPFLFRFFVLLACRITVAGSRSGSG